MRATAITGPEQEVSWNWGLQREEGEKEKVVSDMMACDPNYMGPRQASPPL